MPAPLTAPASSASAVTFFTTGCPLERGEVTLLRCSLELTERPLNVGVFTGCVDEIVIQRSVFALRFDRVLTRLLQ